MALAAFVAALSSGIAWSSENADSVARAVTVTVYKTPNCGCCDNWVAHLQANGFETETNVVADTSPIRERLGVPRPLASCHTAQVGDYWIEGHVPADAIRRLLREGPEYIRGLSVPGMPPGSPGMEVPNPVEYYNVVGVDSAGQFHLYLQAEGRSQP